MEDLSQYMELGLAGVAIIVLGYIVRWLIQELKEQRTDYRSFVQENNHSKTELVKEATAALVEVKNTIQVHNEIQKTNNEIQKNLLEKISKN